MKDPKVIARKIFSIKSEQDFNALALEIFRFQHAENKIYRAFCDALHVDINQIHHYQNIPFLPIEFFREHKIISGKGEADLVFQSSGTTGSIPSVHHVLHQGIYEKSFLKAFDFSYGKPEEYCILALLPSYLEREHSSLVYMVNQLIQKSKNKRSGFFLRNLPALHEKLLHLKSSKQKTLLIGVSFALLDLAEQHPLSFPELIILETGGMKGRRKEMIREELHEVLKKAFEVKDIHSEYGMTELLSQAYAQKDGFFQCPPWMKVLIRDVNDPLSLHKRKRSGGINIIDLANVFSCSFIATQDLGRLNEAGKFEVLGRFDESEVRGCNLMVV